MTSRVFKIEFPIYAVGNQTSVASLQNLTSGTERRQVALVGGGPVDVGAERQISQRSAAGTDATGARIYVFGRSDNGAELVDVIPAGASASTSVFTNVAFRFVDEVWVEGTITGTNISIGTGGTAIVTSNWRQLDYQNNSDGITVQAYTFGSAIDFDIQVTLSDPTWPYSIDGDQRKQPQFSDKFDRADATLDLPSLAVASLNNLSADGAGGTINGPWRGIRVVSNGAMTSAGGVLIAQACG